MPHSVYSAEQIREIMRDRNLSEVARNSGVSYYTLRAFVSGADSRASTIEQLTRYIDTRSAAQ